MATMNVQQSTHWLSDLSSSMQQVENGGGPIYGEIARVLSAIDKFTLAVSQIEADVATIDTKRADALVEIQALLSPLRTKPRKR